MKLKNSTNKIRDLSIEIDKLKIPNHVAVIMDGNGRWGLNKGLTRSHGHNKGVSVNQLVDAAGKLSQNRRGALMVVDLGSDLRPEDFLYSGIKIDALLSTDLYHLQFCGKENLGD